MASILNKYRIKNMHWAGRKLQRGVASLLNKNSIRIMYRGGKKLRRGFYINFESGIEQGTCIGEEVSSIGVLIDF